MDIRKGRPTTYLNLKLTLFYFKTTVTGMVLIAMIHFNVNTLVVFRSSIGVVCNFEIFSNCAKDKKDKIEVKFMDLLKLNFRDYLKRANK